MGKTMTQNQRNKRTRVQIFQKIRKESRHGKTKNKAEDKENKSITEMKEMLDKAKWKVDGDKSQRMNDRPCHSQVYNDEREEGGKGRRQDSYEKLSFNMPVLSFLRRNLQRRSIQNQTKTTNCSLKKI
jgi:hypothetical protein